MKKLVSGEIILPGTEVLAKNYRSPYKPEEPGVIVDASLHVYEDGKTRPSYTVHLNRRGKHDRPIRLYLGGAEVRLQESEKGE